ncbi:MAG: DnaA/Hda family protein [Alphaproteobacteria bacterium]|nr:DnaA/Hda family protein [Alphaproteobacteria bacterium]
MQTKATKMDASLETIKEAIAAKFDTATYTSWIAPLTLDIENDSLVLGATNQFSANFINGVHFGTLSSVASAFGLSLKIVVRSASASVAPVANDNRAQTYTPAPASVAPVAFDCFVTCDENLFVVSACKKVATGTVPFSPLFIYGAAGCGKTLLTECISGAATGRVVKMSGSQFVSEFTRSLQEHNVFAFKDFCRNCDTFILDDVQALSGKRASTDEFLQLVVDLRNAGKNVVLTANAAPNNLTGFDRHAQSLLASGLVADVAAPNSYVKSVMLRRAGVKTDVADSLCARIANDGHMVAGIAKKIRAYVDLMGAEVNMDIANRLLADTLQTVKTPVTMVREMCEKLGVSYDAVCGSGRSRALVLARQTMMVVLKQATQLSLTEIGNFVGGRDHATVLYAIKQIEKQLASDLVLSAQIQQLVSEYK